VDVGLGFCVTRFRSAVRVLALASLLFSFSCAKMDETETTDYGPAADAKVKDQAILKANGVKTLYDIKAGEWIITQLTQRIYTGARNVTGLVAIGVSSIQEDTENRYLRLIVRNIQYNQTTQKSSEDRYLEKVVIPKKPKILSTAATPRTVLEKYLKLQTEHAKSESLNQLGIPPVTPDTPNTPDATTAAEASFSYCQMDSSQQKIPDGFRVSYHNLAITAAVEAPPLLVQQQTDPVCAGLSPCAIHTDTVHYDEVLWNLNGTDHQRYHCSFQFSPDVPYLAGTLKRCLYFLYSAQNHKAPVEICSSTVDFQFGKNQIDPKSLFFSAF
jgi:hypothetical protein